MKTTPDRPNRPNQPGRTIQSSQPNRPIQTNQPSQTNRPSTPEQVSQPDAPQALPATMAKWILLPLRLFLGITFVYAGIQKLADPQYFNPKAPGYIGKQIIGFATNSPLHFLLIHTIEHAVFFGAVVAIGEIAIGLGTLFGVLFRPAAFFGIVINLIFFLTATWHVYPYFYGSDIVFVICWLTLFISGPANTGMPSFDEWFVQNMLPDNVLKVYGDLIDFVLGVKAAPIPAAVSAQSNQQVRQGAGGGRRVQTRYAQAQRAKQQSRRNFVWGVVSGGAGVAVLFWLGEALRVFGGTSPAGSGSTSGSGTSATSNGTSTTSGPTVIAKTSAVPTNSSATFTLASNGDPGVLVHLNDGKFVAFDATCTHAGCPVSYDPSSGMLLCPCHGAVFDPSKNAAVVQGPAPTPLTSVPIQINNGEITTNQ
jgi:thiosulfate dehydrogenase [quinone] large subunit